MLPKDILTSIEKSFEEKFPYKIQGSPKHTPLRFIGREIKQFILFALLTVLKSIREGGSVDEWIRLLDNK